MFIYFCSLIRAEFFSFYFFLSKIEPKHTQFQVQGSKSVKKEAHHFLGPESCREEFLQWSHNLGKYTTSCIFTNAQRDPKSCEHFRMASSTWFAAGTCRKVSRLGVPEGYTQVKTSANWLLKSRFKGHSSNSKWLTSLSPIWYALQLCSLERLVAFSTCRRVNSTWTMLILRIATFHYLNRWFLFVGPQEES